MRDFNQFLAEEGFGDTIKNWVIQKVSSKLGPIKNIIDQAIAEGGSVDVQIQKIMQGIKNVDPSTANQILNLTGKEIRNESSLAEHFARIDVELSPIVGELRKTNEGIDTELAKFATDQRAAQAFGEIGNFLGMLGYGVAGAVILYLLVKFNQPIINTLTSLYRVGKTAISKIELGGESETLKKYKADQANRADARERQKRAAALRAQAQSQSRKRS